LAEDSPALWGFEVAAFELVDDGCQVGQIEDAAGAEDSCLKEQVESDSQPATVCIRDSTDDYQAYVRPSVFLAGGKDLRSAGKDFCGIAARSQNADDYPRDLRVLLDNPRPFYFTQSACLLWRNQFGV